MKKGIVVVVMAIICALSVYGMAFAQGAPAGKDQPAKGVSQTVPMKKPMTAGRPMTTHPMKSAFSMISGTIQKIDKTDPANIKLEVKKDNEDKTYTMSVMPYTTVTKVTDISELKTGDTVRVMSRKTDDKETAMSVVFGNIKPMPPMSAMKKAPAATPGQPSPVVKK